jgi:HlyD family secretion protein
MKIDIKNKKVWIAMIALKIVKVLVVAFLFAGCAGKQLQMETGTAVADTLEITVMTTGTIQPVEKVDVGTQVSGIIEDIYVDFNSTVKAGDLLAELDTQTLLENVSKAEASLESSNADLKYAQANYNRTKQLYDAGAATQVDFDSAVNNLTRARTSRVNAQANLKQARVNLGYAKITSPIDGVVMNRAVEQGQTVASTFNTPTLFTIARDLTKMQVEAAVDEADIGQVKQGQKVTFDVDAYPGDEFSGVVSQVRIEPVTTSNVVTYTVIIEAPNPDLKLFPGMTANVYIVTRSEQGVTVPVEALHFTMSDEVAQKLGVANQPPKSGQVWVKQGEKWAPVAVKAGMQDGVNTIIEEGVAPGDEVLLSAAMEKPVKDRGAAARNPLMPGRRRR